MIDAMQPAAWLPRTGMRPARHIDIARTVLPPEHVDAWQYLPEPQDTPHNYTAPLNRLGERIFNVPMPAVPPQFAVGRVGIDPINRLIADLCKGNILGGDVDALLYNLIGRAVPLERGIVGPTGASSTISFSVLGPIFGLWGLIAGTRIILRAGDAKDYLTTLKKHAQAREAELVHLREQLGDNPQWACNTQDLDLRLHALRCFVQGVDRSSSEMSFNQVFPGGVQLAASILILTLAADLFPRAGGHAALFSPAVTAALGTSAATGLGVYAFASFLKSSYYFVQSWRAHKMGHMEGDGDDMRAFIDEYNRSVGLDRLFYGLNSASWGVYVGGAVALSLIASGVALSHGTAVAAVVSGALAAVIWDALWGNKCAPHNALTPHVDRNYLDTTTKLKDVWVLLDKERRDLHALINDMFESMPPHHEVRAPLNPWKRIDKKKRLKYFWRFIPRLGGRMRLARWAVKDGDVIQPLVRQYLTHYTQYEIEYLRYKTCDKAMSLFARGCELEAHDNSELSNTWQADFLALESEVKRLEAMQALAHDLAALDLKQVGHDEATRVAWNRARLAFLASHGLLGYFLDIKVVRANPEWFEYEEHKRFLRRTRTSNICLSPAGFAALSQQEFTPEMERSFLATVVNPELNAYEIRAVFKKNAQAHRGHKNHHEQGQRRAEFLASVR